MEKMDENRKIVINTTCANKIKQRAMFLDIVIFFQIWEKLAPIEIIGNYNGLNIPSQERIK